MRISDWSSDVCSADLGQPPHAGQPGRFRIPGRNSSALCCPMNFMGGSAMWPDRRIIDLFGITHPIVLAPMAGGPSTPDLAVAVAEGGGLGSLASATSTPDQVRRDMAVIRDRKSTRLNTR